MSKKSLGKEDEFKITIENDNLKIKFALAEWCWSCTESGFGGMRPKEPSSCGDGGVCSICDGTHIKLTDAGEKIINLVKMFKG